MMPRQHARFLMDRFVKRAALELYDLENDEWELNNIADDPEQDGRMAVMQAELNNWMACQGDRGILMDVEFEMIQY